MLTAELPHKSRRGAGVTGRLAALAIVLVATSAYALPLAARAATATCTGTTDPSCAVVAAFGNSSPTGVQGENVFRQPQAVDLEDGRLNVGDRWGWHIQTFDENHAWLRQWGEYGGNGGQFAAVGGVAHDSSHNFYLLDIDHNRVERFDPEHRFVTQWGGWGSGDPGPAVACDGGDAGGPANFNINFKGDIAYDASGGYLYVADSYNQRVVKFDTSGRYICQVGVTGVIGTDTRHFAYPEGITVDPSTGDLYVADDQNDRIQKFDSNGNYVATIGSAPTLNAPYDVALDAAGNVYVANNLRHRIDKYSATGQWIISFGGRGTAPGKLQTPRNLTVDPVGNGSVAYVYVADTNNGRIQEFDGNGTLMATWGLNGRDDGRLTGPKGIEVTDGKLFIGDTLEYWVQVLGPTDGKLLYKFGSHGTANGLFELPGDVAVDSNGTIVVADTFNDRVQRFSPPNSYLDQTRGFRRPRGVAVDGSDNFYVADSDNNRVQEFGPDGTLLRTWSGINADDSFSNPGDVAVSPAGDVYVADTGHDRVVKFDADGNYVRAWPVAGPEPSHPSGIDVDAAGNVYVADPGNGDVQKYDPTGDLLVKWGARGHALGEFWVESPNDVAVDTSGDVYVSDTYNDRVEKFTFSDKTRPMAQATVSPEPNAAGWEKSDTTVTISARDEEGGSGVKQIRYRVGSGGWTTIEGARASVDVSHEGETQLEFAARDNAGNTSAAQTVDVKLDKTAPQVNCEGADGAWHRSDVSVACSGSDTGAGLAHDGDASFTLSTKVPADTETTDAATGSRDVCDLADNCTPGGPVGGNKIDNKAPDITIAAPTDGSSVLLHQAVAADYGCVDGGSGLASCDGTVPNGRGIDTGSVGSKSFRVGARDEVGNEASVGAAYNVIYDYAGFYAPVNNPPALNTVKAGAAIPVKFGLHGDQGLEVLAGPPSSTAITCDRWAQLDPVETLTTSASGLTYDSDEGQYVYVWKTVNSWAGSCRQLVLRLDDSTIHRASFEFR
jgi:DNA-binding beta-propeller fold protein YncE